MERSAWPKNLSSSRKHAITELLHAQNPTKKLRDLFDAHSQTGNNTGQPLFAEDLIVNAFRSFSNTLSLSSSSESYEVLQVPTNACVRSEVSEGSESINTPVPRKTSDTWTILDQNLIDDGRQWRTYDQILILNSELARQEQEFSFFAGARGPRASHKKPRRISSDLFHLGHEEDSLPVKRKAYECSICGLEFMTGQALGGHIRRHRPAMLKMLAAATKPMPVSEKLNSKRVVCLDLNLTPMENDLTWL